MKASRIVKPNASLEVSLAKRGVIKPLLSNRFKLNEITEALSMLKEGKILGREVINP
jgi:alcohol dehydrogenase, propanol-preferring